jgi:hypothetical protein
MDPNEIHPTPPAEWYKAVNVQTLLVAWEAFDLVIDFQDAGGNFVASAGSEVSGTRWCSATWEQDAPRKLSCQNGIFQFFKNSHSAILETYSDIPKQCSIPKKKIFSSQKLGFWTCHSGGILSF